jgi:hypothetical protein
MGKGYSRRPPNALIGIKRRQENEGQRGLDDRSQVQPKEKPERMMRSRDQGDEQEGQNGQHK